MSDNIHQQPSCSNASSRPKKSKRKYDKTKLPTPPPDPNESPKDPEKEKEEFLEYLDSLQKYSNTPAFSRSTSLFAPVTVTDEALDHLEKLYKLTDQMLDLKEQNARLHRKIRDLEYITNLEKLDKIDLSSIEVNCPSLDRDTALAESYLEALLTELRKENKNQKTSTPNRLRHSILRRQRNRTGSGNEKTLELDQMVRNRRVSTCGGDDVGNSKSSKVSKWKKVKSAFKWEKASVGDAKSQDSGLGGMVPVNVEVARYLRVPSTSEDAHSPADSGAAGISTPGTLSTASSNEDFHRTDFRSPCEDLRSSEDEYSHTYIPHSKEEPSSSQKSSIKSHRTPWAKMKDIIQTRNSFKKKNRLSTHSDDIQIDIELCSDNEDVFEDDTKDKSSQQPSPKVSKKGESNGIPQEIIARYQQVLAEDNQRMSNVEVDKNSRWSRVKRAFLTYDSGKFSRQVSQTDDTGDNVQAEINRSYRQLQKKLSLEFQEKLNEWERSKQHSPGTSNPSSSCGDEARDPNFLKKIEEWQKIKLQPKNLQLASEEQLPLEFRKKLEEWKKIKKTSNKETSTTSKKKLGEVPRWKSLGGAKTDSAHTFEYPTLSEDFRKKLEEWKQIKAGGGPICIEDPEAKKSKENKSPSPRLNRKDSSIKHFKKQQKDLHEKELHWFEKELTKIDKEKQRLEREKQKFLEREERLAKLRRTVAGSKKEILVQTPSGYYRFEGISRKFTQKLYEWEKAQGIAPEASTFALLSASYTANTAPQLSNTGNTPPLTRSKSADSMMASSGATFGPLLSQQPSSLSLNDVEDLEKKRLEANEKVESIHFLARSSYSIDQDEEPEALIVEVEDIVEETASPLQPAHYAERRHHPIYCREEMKAMCEGETCAAPKIRRSESARAQTNYNLIEEVFNVLSNLGENESEIDKIENENTTVAHGSKSKLKSLYETQNVLSTRLADKLYRLQEANSNITTNLTTDANVDDILEQVQDLSSEILQMAEKLDIEMHKRKKEDPFFELIHYSALMEILKSIRAKVLQLRRHLSYVCAASDLTAPGKKRSGNKRVARKTTSNESNRTDTDLSRGSSEKNSKEGRLFIKSETCNAQSQGAIKKRIKYRQKTMQNRSLPDSDDEEECSNDQKRNKHRKLTRTRSISESSTLKDIPVEVKKVPSQTSQAALNKIIIETDVNYVSLNQDPQIEKDSPVTVFVKTTRKLFTPLVESQLKDTNTENDLFNAGVKQQKGETKATSEESGLIMHLPQFPASPLSQRKMAKDISPSIKLMLAKYNQKLSEKEAGCKSGGSSGSASPVAWRSPTSERRVKAQTEKYQEEINKLSPLLGGRREVQKSASVGFIHSGNKQVTVPNRNPGTSTNSLTGTKNVQKSLSTSEMSHQNQKSKAVEKIKLPPLKVVIDNDELTASQRSLVTRQMKLQRAKEEFLQATPPVSAPPVMSSHKNETLNFPSRNRLSQISVESESSFGSSCAGILIKSASAGMINVDADTYKQIDPELHGGGYVSLPRNSQQPKLSGKFTFSKIASKFRKVKMRRGKEKDASKMNAVSTLCRQSLLVDINNDRPENESVVSEPSQQLSQSVLASTSACSSWIKKAHLFKK